LYRRTIAGFIVSIVRPTKWVRVGSHAQAIGDIGFPMVFIPQCGCRLVFPMDGSTVWPRVSLGENHRM
jgi:hypothetical protein